MPVISVLFVLAVCGIIAGGTFLAMYLAIWSTRDDPARAPAFRQHIVSELIWATVPILMLLAAAFPAAMAIVSGTRH
jgi:heme/copper-type cytochrome/quinol oxidase subunit 2